MPYATVTDLQDRLGEPRLTRLTDLVDPPVGLVDIGVAQKALDDADAEIDGYLVGRYPLPLSPVPPILRVHAVTVAHYRLLGPSVDDATAESYKNVLGYLTKVAGGSINLLPPSDAAPLAGVGSVLFDSGSKVMGRET